MNALWAAGSSDPTCFTIAVTATNISPVRTIQKMPAIGRDVAVDCIGTGVTGRATNNKGAAISGRALALNEL